MAKRFFFSRAFLITIATTVGILAYAYLWGTQTVLALTLRHQAKKLVILRETPQPLHPIPANSDRGMTLVHAGFGFEVPWEDLDLANCKFGGNIAIFKFRSGRTIDFFGPGNNHEDLLSTLEKSTGTSGGELRRLFGEDATKTNYAFLRAMLEETPDNVTPFESQREAARSGMLLMVKAISSVGGETGLFKLKSKAWNGFQFDDPSKKPKRVTLELYDSQDRHVEIEFYSGTTGAAELTQSDINRTIQTLRTADEPQTIPLENTFQKRMADAQSSGPGSQ
jgi:hypothetical protein